MPGLDLDQIVGAFHDCTSRQIPVRVAAAVAEAGEQLADLAQAGPLTPEQIREATATLHSAADDPPRTVRINGWELIQPDPARLAEERDRLASMPPEEHSTAAMRWIQQTYGRLPDEFRIAQQKAAAEFYADQAEDAATDAAIAEHDHLPGDNR